MVLKLDPSIPIVWRDPFSLQFGIDPARVVLREVSAAQERMIAALVSGVSRSGLSMIARSTGAHESDVERLLVRVAPLLAAQLPRALRHRVAIVGTGPTADRIASAINETGALVETGPEVSDSPCDLGVTIGSFVLEPQTYGFWLRRDLPHLPVVFSEASVTIGPMIEPGGGPCLYCLEHHRRDADASWAAIASQLWGLRASAETPLASREAAILASRLVSRRLELGPRRGDGAATSFRLSAETGELTRRDWLPHPDCGCIAVPGARPNLLSAPGDAQRTAAS